MMEVWANVADKDGKVTYRKIAGYADNFFRMVRGYHRGMDFKSDGLMTYMA